MATQTHAKQRSGAVGVMMTVLTHGLVVEQRHPVNKQTNIKMKYKKKKIIKMNIKIIFSHTDTDV